MPVIIARAPVFSSNSAWLGVSNNTLAGWKVMGLRSSVRAGQQDGNGDLPDHALVLLLSDVSRHLAVHLTRAQCHSQCFGHVGLYRCGNRRVLVGRPDPNLG
jgi:hypothetical protein